MLTVILDRYQIPRRDIQLRTHLFLRPAFISQTDYINIAKNCTLKFVISGTAVYTIE